MEKQGMVSTGKKFSTAALSSNDATLITHELLSQECSMLGKFISNPFTKISAII